MPAHVPASGGRWHPTGCQLVQCRQHTKGQHPELACVWLSAAVEKTWDFLVGMVVLREMSLVITPPSVSMP